MFVRIAGLMVRWTMWTIAIAWIHFSSFIAPLAMRVEYSPEKYRSLERLAVTVGTPIWEWSAWLLAPILAPIASFIFATNETKVYNLFVNSTPRDGASYIAFFVLVLMMVFFLGIVPAVWRRVLATLHVTSRRMDAPG